MYGFENIHPTNLTCFQAVAAASPDEGNPNAGDGAGDAWADYQKPFDAATSVSGVADVWNQPLKGNFNQLKQLKAKYPNLKVMVSLGGWTYSKYFSRAAATATSRAKLVSSCIDMFIKGNLPKGIAGDTTSGGTGVAAGIFDGIDIDWEFPAAPGHTGNIYGPADTANYTALLAEFRRQLDVLGAANGKRYLLASAVPSSPENVRLIQVPSVANYLDFASLMTYDMHGAWEGTGPTNFQAPLLPSPADPAKASHFTVHESVNAWLGAGMPANKIVVGIPAYWRGWTGVTAGGMRGLYRPATGASPPMGTTQSGGVANYRELLAAGKLNTVYYDGVTRSPWAYDGTNFWTGDTPATASAKAMYAKGRGLRGAMVFALDGDSSSAALVKAIASGLAGTPVKSPTIGTNTYVGVTNASATYTYWCNSGAGSVQVLKSDGSAANVSVGIPVTGNGVDYTIAVTPRAAGTYVVWLTCGSVRAASPPLRVLAALSRPAKVPGAETPIKTTVPRPDGVNDLEEDFRGLINGCRVASWDNCARLGDHYLDRSGTDAWVTMGHLLAGEPPLRDSFQNWLRIKVRAGLDGMAGVGRDVTRDVPLSTGWQLYAATGNNDWHYAMGSFSFAIAGTMSIGPANDAGVRPVQLNYRTYVYDLYDFGPGGDFGQYAELVSQGRASEFWTYGEGKVVSRPETSAVNTATLPLEW
jgi:GH18 family chitinase